MADNVFRYRRLKWGDPDEKLKMLPDDPVSSSQKLPWIEIGLVAFIAVAMAISAYHLS